VLWSIRHPFYRSESCYETWLPNIAEIAAALKLLAGSATVRCAVHSRERRLPWTFAVYSKVNIPYFRDWKLGRFRTTSLIIQMWFILYLDFVSIFAKYCSSITRSDSNYKSFTFTPTSGTSSKPERTILHFFPGTPSQRYGRRAVKRIEGNEDFKKQNIVTNNACLCSATTLTSKIIITDKL